MAELTPMMRQYREIKSRTPDCILFFRLGDFYEMFDEDAKTASRELDLTLTTRDRGKEPEDQTPMCGVPYHSSEAYIARLLAKGYKVAICEQMEDPALAKGLVSREVVRIITPGTVIDSSMLDENKPNYIASVYLDSRGGAVCFADISTGEFSLAEFSQKAESHIVNELSRYRPAEAVINSGAAQSSAVTGTIKALPSCPFQVSDERFDFMLGAARICEQFSASDLDELGLGSKHSAVCAAGALLSYIHETQKTDLTHINTINLYTSGRYMELDMQTRRNLELTETLRMGEKKGSLLWVIDKTKTPMGGRLLRSWLEKPLLTPAVIKRRLNAVDELCRENIARNEIMLNLREIGDIERLISRIVYGTANCRDLVALSSSVAKLPVIKKLLSPMKSLALRELSALDTLEDIGAKIDRAIVDDPPFSVREGGMIRPGYSEEVDRLRRLTENVSSEIESIALSEREKTGIKKLKVGYNKVFGYYIEIPRSQSSEAPESYVRKQTLANCERFITQELKELEASILTAHERLKTLEYELFTELREGIAAEVVRIQKTAAAVSEADVLASLAETAVRNNYCMPEVDLSDVIDIKEGRHPVVERTHTGGLFVPNDVYLDCGSNRTLIITGPNMAGKSTYMRQTALIVLMAQIGSFVPAKSARIGIVDRIFTRIGASDDLAAGQSTFMVEMHEVAQILKNASPKSLLVLDEIGRGTSTFDGMAIARAVMEYCNDKTRLGAKTMFATHYHELTVLENELEGVKNYNISAKKRGDEVIFLRKIVPGGADDSFGIEVAKLAGVPDYVIRRAKTVLASLEGDAPRGKKKLLPILEGDSGQLSLENMAADAIAERLRMTDLDTITPLEAMNLLYELKRSVE
jgi:DNA mismatch repair protein MutS